MSVKCMSVSVRCMSVCEVYEYEMYEFEMYECECECEMYEHECQVSMRCMSARGISDDGGNGGRRHADAAFLFSKVKQDDPTNPNEIYTKECQRLLSTTVA